MKVKFYNSNGATLVGYLFKPLFKTDSAVIICHGFFGFKEAFRIWGRILALRGFIVLAFDFTGNGESDGFLTDGTISQEIYDLNSAINFLKKKYIIKKLAVVGHSLGGTVAMLAASKNKDIDCVIVLAPAAELKGKKYRKYANMMADIWESKGLCEIIRCKKMRTLDVNFIRDANNHDVVKAVKKVKVPLLVIHGDADSTIHMNEGKLVYDNAGSNKKKFHILKGVDHYFNKRRWETSQLVTSWLKKWLKWQR
jgi:putative redox protein